MGRTLEKSRGRKASNGYNNWPHVLLDHENWTRMSAHAQKLVMDVYSAYRGNNNGNLSAAWKLMQPRGWRSKGTLHKAIREAVHFGMIIRTRQGGKNKPTLFAVTWKPIDACKVHLDVKPTSTPPGDWKETRQPYREN